MVNWFLKMLKKLLQNLKKVLKNFMRISKLLDSQNQILLLRKSIWKVIRKIFTYIILFTLKYCVVMTLKCFHFHCFFQKALTWLASVQDCLQQESDFLLVGFETTAISRLLHTRFLVKLLSKDLKIIRSFFSLKLFLQ